MKKIVCSILGAIAVLFAGCDPFESDEAIAKLSNTIGVTAGYVCQLTKIDVEVKDQAVAILEAVNKTVPKEDATYVDTWKPLIEDGVAKVVAAGKLTEAQGTIVKTIVTTATEGIDYLFSKKPTWKTSADKANLAINSFTEGFFKVVSAAANPTLAAKNDMSEIDKEAYDFLCNKMKK